jgi:putative PIN family toxin of toxin-antitoxin system
MRVLIDSNVFINYLLTPRGAGPIRMILQAWSQGEFTLLIPEALLEEIQVTVRNRPHLSRRIPLELLGEFLDTIKALSEESALITDPIPTVTRDSKDDYLLAYALVGAADYLITGDDDLLTLDGAIHELRILTPRAFAELLRSLH